MPINQAELKKFAQKARRELKAQVAARLEQVLRTDSVELRQREGSIRELNNQIASASKQEVIDRVAYTWFNRFCALRYMDANGYSLAGILSPAEGRTQPQLLELAKNGQTPPELASLLEMDTINGLLGGSLPSSDPQGEAYRLLLVAACNYYNEPMPFLFESIHDYSELLMPRDLLSGTSILAELRQVLTPDSCQDVEVIGWLYQYYISERKDEVFEGLKSNKKIEKEDIPAATQLFTPHWIVRYLVENSLGRLWLLNKPNSGLAKQMPYYIQPAQAEEDYLKVATPEELKVLDPACGSGHMLTYAFDLLFNIYEEQGYTVSEIPSLILKHNLYGVEIDGRAGALAAFALAMKARSKDRRFFTRGIAPQVCVLEDITFTPGELKDYMSAVGRDLFTEPLRDTLEQFEESGNFGSLIRPRLRDVAAVRQQLADRKVGADLLLANTHAKAQKVLNQAEMLSQRYHVVVANPPYMGGRGLNADLREFGNRNYPDSKSDLFAMFIERGFALAMPKAYSAMVTMQSWMFLSSYEDLRKLILEKHSIETMAQLGPRAFDSIGGEVVQTTAFTLRNATSTRKGSYIRLVDGVDEADKARMLVEAVTNPDCGWFYRTDAGDFRKIPGAPIAYWVGKEIIDLLSMELNIGKIAPPKVGMMTTDNDRFLRLWFEISRDNLSYSFTSVDEAVQSEIVWFPYNKGGRYRKWFGNLEYVVNWYKGGRNIEKNGNRSFSGKEFYFKKGITWSDIGTGKFSCRLTETGFIYDIKGTSCFPNDNDLELVMSSLNSNLGSYLLSVLNPSVSFQTSDIKRIPLPDITKEKEDLLKIINQLILISKKDWNRSETSPHYDSCFLIEYLPKSHDQLRNIFSEKIKEINIEVDVTKKNEEAMNSLLLSAFKITNNNLVEILPEEITLTCNPVYRYGAGKSEEEYAALQKADTMKELISYAVGCMFGRYSLDKPGLILANQGDTLKDYLAQVPQPSYLPDDDNVIPILDGDWFSDDISERFKQFLKVSFGVDHYSENLAFIEEAIGRDIRSYFLKDFYPYHLKMYKKRPIYWLFSSPKGSFNALIYLHRYTPDTVSIVLNKYLREFRNKLAAQKSYLQGVTGSANNNQTQKTAALKELDKLEKIQKELEEYESKTLYPLATQRLAIDLDDGVKVNYLKFGDALAKIQGLT